MGRPGNLRPRTPPSAHLAATIPINSCLQTLFQPLPRPPHPVRDTSRITAEPPTDAPRCLPLLDYPACDRLSAHPVP